MLFFLLVTASRSALGPTQPPIEWVVGALTSGVKWMGREADHLSPSSAEVKTAWSYTPLPLYFFTAWYLLSTGTSYLTSRERDFVANFTKRYVHYTPHKILERTSVLACKDMMVHGVKHRNIIRVYGERKGQGDRGTGGQGDVFIPLQIIIMKKSTQIPAHVNRRRFWIRNESFRN